MTTEMFLTSLQEKLMFLSEEDRRKILAFYADMLAKCESPDDANKKLLQFGTPDEIADKLRAVAAAQAKTADETAVSEGDVNVSADETVAVKENTVPATDATAKIEEETVENGNETVVLHDDAHVTEDKTVVAADPTVLTGGDTVAVSDPTVIAAQHALPSDDTIPAPRARTHLPRPELHENWETLYDDSAEEPIKKAASDDEDEEGERISFKRREKRKKEKKADEIEYIEEAPKKEVKELRPITGSNLMEKMMKNSGKTPEEAVGTFKMLRALFILSLLLVSVLLIFGYVAALAIIAGVTVGLLLLTILFGVCGIAGLAYAIVSFFTQSAVISVIEIGLATILFSVVTALVALCHELIAGVIPVLLKKLTQLYFWLVRWFCYKFTGKNSLRDLFAGQKQD